MKEEETRRDHTFRESDRIGGIFLESPRQLFHGTHLKSLDGNDVTLLLSDVFSLTCSSYPPVFTAPPSPTINTPPRPFALLPLPVVRSTLPALLLFIKSVFFSGDASGHFDDLGHSGHSFNRLRSKGRVRGTTESSRTAENGPRCDVWGRPFDLCFSANTHEIH